MTPPFEYDKSRELQMSADEKARGPFPGRIVTDDKVDRVVAEVVPGGAETIARLEKAGIITVEDLLSRCARPADREAVSAASGIAAAHLLDWASTAELLRISGITPAFATMLKAIGAGTIASLREREADRVSDAILALTAERSMTALTPSAAVVDGWIRQARRLTPIVIESTVSNRPSQSE